MSAELRRAAAEMWRAMQAVNSAVESVILTAAPERAVVVDHIARDHAAVALIESDAVGCFDDSISGYAAASAAVDLLEGWSSYDDDFLRENADGAYKSGDTREVIDQLHKWIARGCPGLPPAAPPWVILATDGSGLYWSNTDGWGSRATATEYDNADLTKYRLPVGGAWVRLTAA